MSRDYIADLGITATAERVSTNPNMEEDFQGDHWKVQLRRVEDGRRTLTVYFSKGYGHHGAEPTAREVLDCLAMDVTEEDFASWCRELGFEEDSRKAERIYKTTIKQTAALRRFLGPNHFDTLVYDTERD